MANYNDTNWNVKGHYEDKETYKLFRFTALTLGFFYVFNLTTQKCFILIVYKKYCSKIIVSKKI